MNARNKLFLMMHLIVTIILAFFLIFSNESINTLTILIYSIVGIFIWMIYSTLKIGYSLTHPYSIFLYSAFGFIIWNIFFTAIGLIDFWDNLWIADELFSNITIKISTLRLVLIFLLFTHLGMLTHRVVYPELSFEDKIPNIDNSKLQFIKEKSKLFFNLSLPFFSIYILSYVFAVYEYGYFILYDPEQFYRVPAWLSLADDISRTFFWIYIATKPTLKESKKTILIYSIITFISLGTGTRGIIFSEFFALIAAVSYLGYKLNVKKIVSFGIIILFLSPVIENLRVKNYSTNDTLITSMINSQGLPLLSVAGALTYEDKLPENKSKYILGPIIEFIHSFDTDDNLSKNENDLYRLPQVISYYVDESSFVGGWGMGNTIISEFYIFGGTIGLCILSFTYIFFILNLFEKFNSFTAVFISFISMRMIFFSVRENPAYIIVHLVYPFIIYLFFLAYIRYQAK